jgi:hypothetical protein
VAYSSRRKVFGTNGLGLGEHFRAKYLEVRGYANAADWVYGHGIHPGEWSKAELAGHIGPFGPEPSKRNETSHRRQAQARGTDI